MKTHPKYHIPSKLILVGATLFAASLGSAADFVNNFDAAPVGSPPPGWTVGTQPTLGSANVSTAQFVSASNSVALYTASNFVSGSTYMYRTDLSNSPTGPFSYFSNDWVYTSVRLTSTNQFLNLQVVDTGLTAAFQVHFNQGSIKAYNGASLLTLGTYTSNEWYRVEMVTKPSTLKYSLAVYDSANTVVASGTGFDYNVVTSPQGLFFINYGTISGSPLSTTAYIDNVFVGVPEPTSLLLLGLGGLLGLRRRFG